MSSLIQHTLAKRFLAFSFNPSGISTNTKPPLFLTVNMLPTIYDGIALHSRLPKKSECHVPP